MGESIEREQGRFKDFLLKEPFWIRRLVFTSSMVKLGDGETKYIRIPKSLTLRLVEKLGHEPWEEECIVGLEETKNSIRFYVAFPKEGIEKREVFNEVKSLCISSRSYSSYGVV